MLIEIQKAGFVNKGAALMLLCILQQVKQRFPGADFAITPNSLESPYEQFCKLGFYQKAWLWRCNLQWGFLASIVPPTIRKAYGIVLDKEIDVVLDAAGFAYSNQWGDAPCTRLAWCSRKWKKQGTKLILLPQAFGPFDTEKSRKAMSVVADNAELIFARERVSYDHLTSVVGARDNIKMAPDFTNLIEGMVPVEYSGNDNQICIIPNCRMLDKTNKGAGTSYLQFLEICVRHLVARNTNPFFLIHEGEGDLTIATRICEATGIQIPIVEEADPLKIKGILKVCDGVIGSRYHGLVSALSQGIPSLGIGWSHKYRLLFEDYNFKEGMLDLGTGEKAVKEKIDLLTDEELRNGIKKIITERSAILKKTSEAMWEVVFSVMQSVGR